MKGERVREYEWEKETNTVKYFLHKMNTCPVFIKLKSVQGSLVHCSIVHNCEPSLGIHVVCTSLSQVMGKVKLFPGVCACVHTYSVGSTYCTSGSVLGTLYYSVPCTRYAFMLSFSAAWTSIYIVAPPHP